MKFDLQKIKNNPGILFNLLKILIILVCIGLVFTFKLIFPQVELILAEGSSEKEESIFEMVYKKPVLIPTAEIPIDNQPDISAKSAAIIDANSFEVLYEKNADQQLPMASVTKIMTALVALKNFSPSQLITIDSADIDIGGSSMYLVKGETFTVENLIKGLLIPSGNDVALTFKNEFANLGKDLVGEMNTYAKSLGLNKTHFMNASGLDSDDHYSSARDLSILGIYSLKEYTVRNAVSMVETTVYSNDGIHGHYLKNTNELLGRVEGIKGIKTGTTQNAGQCLVSAFDRNGHEIVITILGSSDRYSDTEKLSKWVYENYIWL